VAVRYLRTRAINSNVEGHRYLASPPTYRIAAYSRYELVEIQKEITT